MKPRRTTESTESDEVHNPPAIDLDGLRRRHTCTVETASQMLGIGRSTAYAAARDGSLPTLRVGHRLLVPTAKLLAMLGLGDDARDAP